MDTLKISGETLAALVEGATGIPQWNGEIDVLVLPTKSYEMSMSVLLERCGVTSEDFYTWATLGIRTALAGIAPWLRQMMQAELASERALVLHEEREASRE